MKYIENPTETPSLIFRFASRISSSECYSFEDVEDYIKNKDGMKEPRFKISEFYKKFSLISINDFTACYDPDYEFSGHGDIVRISQGENSFPAIWDEAHIEGPNSLTLDQSIIQNKFKDREDGYSGLFFHPYNPSEIPLIYSIYFPERNRFNIRAKFKTPNGRGGATT